VIVSAEDPMEAAALCVALTAAGLPSIPGTLDDVTDDDAVVLVRPGGINGEDLTIAARGAMVVAAGPPEVASMLTAVEHGALAYLEADAPYERFIASVESAERGEATVPPQMLGALLHRVIEQQREQRVAVDQLEVLSPRERQVFDLVVQGAGKHTIAEKLFISPETARTHIQNVMNKLGATSRVELVGLAAAAGLPTIPAEEPR
jgi:DNA-binding NarL/FixJ family response regulator